MLQSRYHRNSPKGTIARYPDTPLLAAKVILRPILDIIVALPGRHPDAAEVASTLPLIEKFNEEGLTIIMIEHRLKELFRVVDRVMVLNFGMTLASGTPEQVMESDEVKKAYLGIHIDLD